MTLECDGLTLSDADVEAVQQLHETPSIAEKRKAVTLYKANDPGLAMFRLTAGRTLLACSVRAVLNRPLRKEQREFVAAWWDDGNTLIREYLEAINEALGREYFKK